MKSYESDDELSRLPLWRCAYLALAVMAILLVAVPLAGLQMLIGRLVKGAWRS